MKSLNKKRLKASLQSILLKTINFYSACRASLRTGLQAILLKASNSSIRFIVRRRGTLQAILLKASNHKPKLIVAVIIFIAILSVLTFYTQKKINTKTYYVAYVGKYNNLFFDELHEIALDKYINELNVDLDNVRLELKPYNLKDYNNDSNQLYQTLLKNEQTVIILDNSWGSDFQRSADLIRNERLPVINMNSDKLKVDYGNKAVFLGQDDEIPNKVANFCKKILGKEKVIFITEFDYALAFMFHEQFAVNNIKINEISVESSTPDSIDRANLFRNLDNQLNETQSQSNNKSATVVLNVHQNWGNEVVSHIEDNFENVEIVGGPFIINSTKYELEHGYFDQDNKGNKLFTLTSPADSLSQKIYNDFNKIKMSEGAKPESFNNINNRRYVKRCLDAVSLIREALLVKPGVLKSKVSRDTFIKFFQNSLAGKASVIGNELYIFDDNLMVFDDSPFELRSQGEITTYNKQLNTKLETVPNVYFGIDSPVVSNIDVERRSFHADFFYWIKGAKDNLNIDQYIQFRNERKQNEERDIPISRDDSIGYKLFKKSADFNMDVDFKKYPFDTQELRIEVEIIDPENKVTISFDNSDYENSKKKAMNFNLDQWAVKDFYITVDNFIATSLRGRLIAPNRTPQKFKTLNVRMIISRDWAVPFVTIILPLWMIGIASIAILFIKDNAFAHIGEVCVGIFLSIVTYSISFAQLTPRSNRLTIADMLFYGTFFLVLSIFLKVIFLNSILITDDIRKWLNDRSDKAGYFALFGYCLFILVIAIYALNLDY